MRKLFSEFGLSMVAAICGVIVVNIYMKHLNISEVLILWLKRLM